MSDYIQELNEGQRAAVLYNDGPSLVIAGAGSGKTRVLTYKIAYLLENGYRPWDILALTFTNKAAREMKERIARQVGAERARHLWMGTFHSIFLRILHAEAAQIGFTPKFTVYDTADSKSLLRSIIKEVGLDEKVYKPGTVQARISNAKNHLVSPAGYANNKEAYESDSAAKMPAIRDIYRRYWERCRQAGGHGFRRFAVLYLPAFPRPSGGACTLSVAVPLYSGGRVPGHQLCPAQHCASVGKRASARLCGGR